MTQSPQASKSSWSGANGEAKKTKEAIVNSSVLFAVQLEPQEYGTDSLESQGASYHSYSGEVAAYG
jgi:hypothetical protein